jgi:hypothetical protein
MRFKMILCAFRIEMLALIVLATLVVVAQSKADDSEITALSIPPSAFW